MSHADQQLVKRLLKGDQKSFDSFFSSYFPRLFRFVLPRTGGDEDLAEEVVQGALCKAMQKLQSYRGEAALFTWLCSFCRFELSTVLKKANRINYMPDLSEDDPVIRSALESLALYSAHDPQLICSRSEIATLVCSTLDYLPSLYSDTLELKYVHGLSVNEIAERIGRTPKAVESILTRARNAFKDSFAGLYEDSLTLRQDV